MIADPGFEWEFSLSGVNFEKDSKQPRDKSAFFA